MSFILDALRRSENERQQQQAAEFATMPSAASARPAPRWLWLVGLLLVMNVVVLGAFLLRDDRSGKTIEPAAAGAADTAPLEAGASTPAEAPRTEGTTTFSERLAAVRESRPAAGDAAAAGTAPDGAGSPVAPMPATRPAPAAPGPGIATLPSLEELVLDGALDLPPLHIDLHVYNEAAARRFVSINMQKYHENERLREGPVVREITREGVVLEHNGRLFALLQ